MIVKMWNLNDSLTIGLIQWRLLTCWAQERGFQLWNSIILLPKCSRLKFPGPRMVFRLTLTPAHTNYDTDCQDAAVSYLSVMQQQHQYNYQQSSVSQTCPRRWWNHTPTHAIYLPHITYTNQVTAEKLSRNNLSNTVPWQLSKQLPTSQL